MKLELVVIYQLQFEEKLWATMLDMPATFQVSHFMNGLLPELHKQVRGAVYPDLEAAVKAATKEEAKQELALDKEVGSQGMSLTKIITNLISWCIQPHHAPSQSYSWCLPSLQGRPGSGRLSTLPNMASFLRMALTVLLSHPTAHNSTIVPPFDFFQVDDLPVLTLGELMFTSSGHLRTMRRERTTPSLSLPTIANWLRFGWVAGQKAFV